MQNMCIALLQDQVSDTTFLGDKWCWDVIAAKFLLWLQTARPVISQECQATEDIGSQMSVL